MSNDGARPRSTLVVGPDGNFYGTTYAFPGQGLGTIYRITPDGSRTTLFDFTETLASDPPGILGPRGCFPSGRLAVGPDAFYGTTTGCGLYDGGTFFRLAFSGGLTVLHQFPTGHGPSGGVAFAPDGDLFGITMNGGTFNLGTVFRWDGAALTTIHSFDAITGQYPDGDLMLASDGNIYGAARGGDTPGTLFRIVSSDTVELFHTFISVVEGVGPNGGLLQASDGHLYGTTGEEGGVVYRITLGGELTPLHTGIFSSGNLLEGFGGVIYGTTGVGGLSGPGTIFQITPAGVLTTLHTFSGPDGRQPEAGLTRGTDGHIYGTTYGGGDHDLGTFFRIAMPRAVVMTANHSHGPLVVAAGTPLTFRMAVDVPGPSVIDPARLLVGVSTPFGLLWVGPSGFGTTPALLYSGPLPGFGPAVLFTLPTLAGAPPGSYVWFAVIVDGTNQVIFDTVETIVPAAL